MRMERRGNRQRKAAFPDSVKEARVSLSCKKFVSCGSGGAWEGLLTLWVGGTVPPFL